MNSLKTVCDVVGGRFFQPRESDLSFSTVSTDTRADIEGSLFVALRGDRFDAHYFLAQAIAKKPSALLIDREEALPAELDGMPVIIVDDTLVAFQTWARYIRKQSTSTYYGVTGSNGKTTTKRFLATLLGPSTYCSQGSFNNHWGVPMTLLAAADQYANVVVEMGMNNAGEIDHLASMVLPDYSCVTTVSEAHIEFFDSIEGISRAKAEIYPHTTRGAAFNLDNPFTREHLTQIQLKEKVTFSTIDPSADVYLKVQEQTVEGLRIGGHIGGEAGEQTLPCLGDHNASNIAAASALALMGGVAPAEIWLRIPQCEMEWGRNMLVQGPRATPILFDAYNANPQSFSAFLSTVEGLGADPLTLVIGSMKELGDQADSVHTELAQRVAKMRPQFCVFVGDHAALMAQVFTQYGGGDHQALTQAEPNSLENRFRGANSLIAAKGSRGVKLEEMFPQVSKIINKN